MLYFNDALKHILFTVIWKGKEMLYFNDALKHILFTVIWKGKEMLYFNDALKTYFIYGYMERKGNALF